MAHGARAQGRQGLTAKDGWCVDRLRNYAEGVTQAA